MLLQGSMADATHTFKKMPINITTVDRGDNHKNEQHGFIKESMIEKDFLQEQDLMLISAESWKKLIDDKTAWLADIPSTLVLSVGNNHR
jgi:hypothetical protein